MKKSKGKERLNQSKPKSKPVLEPNLEGLGQDKGLDSNDRYLLNSLLDNLPESIYFKDTKSRFIRISRSLAKAFGLKDPSQAIGKTDFDFFSSEHAQMAFDNEKEIVRTGRTMSIEEKETWHDRPDTWVLSTKMPLYGENGKIIGTFGISKDITDRKIAEDKLRLQSKSLQKQIQEINVLHDKLREQACRDTLTGLSNRRMMDAVLTQQLQQCQQLEQPLSIFIIDIDNFKSINDEYGHLVGDAILEKLGMCIKNLTRSDDFSCRLGGDEILMAFQNMSIQQAKNKAQIMRKKLGALCIKREKQHISITVSIGIATYPMHGDNANKLIKHADEALYLAKERGRNQIASASEVESTL